MIKPTIHVIKLKNIPIFRQLQLEEALLRLDQRNFCLINSGSNAAIVMGISGDPDLLIDKKMLKGNPVPVIRRFSGGGTVFVNEETFFITFICNSSELNVPCYPQHIFNWSQLIYDPVFETKHFKLQENDYVIENKKFGGNAQYLSKNRWLHHTSLLFDYDPAQMDYLKFPAKVPKYRDKRSHADFLCKLKDTIPCKGILSEKIELSLQRQFHLQELALEEIEHLIHKPHRKSTTIVDVIV